MQGVPPDGSRGGRKPSSTTEDIPDYQDSLRKYALGLVENREEEGEHSEVKGEKKERSREENKEGRQHSREESEEGGQRSREEKEEGGQHSREEKEEGGQHSREEKEEEEEECSGVEKDRRREDEEEGSKEVSEKKKAGKDSLLPEKANPSSGHQPKHPHPQLHRPPDQHYPPHMMHSSLQNGFPSEADLARMHSHYPPPPLHMYAPPPYGPRHFDPQHRNGVPPAPSHHPAYASYYAHHQRMPYYPSHPYMQGELSF